MLRHANLIYSVSLHVPYRGIPRERENRVTQLCSLRLHSCLESLINVCLDLGHKQCLWVFHSKDWTPGIRHIIAVECSYNVGVPDDVCVCGDDVCVWGGSASEQQCELRVKGQTFWAITHITQKYESISCSVIWLFTDSREVDHLFSFNGFSRIKNSMVPLSYWQILQMVESGWHVGLQNALRSESCSWLIKCSKYAQCSVVEWECLCLG